MIKYVLTGCVDTYLFYFMQNLGGIIMTMYDVIKFLLEVFAILLGCYLIYREKDLIEFEKKVWRYIKAFFKTVEKRKDCKKDIS